jgi:hypothetical protein
MKEKEVRSRIEQFLRTTARNVVVPASMGLGLAACSSRPLHSAAADAGRDSAAQISDVAVLGPEVRDAAVESDLPLMAIPYMVALPRDAADADPGRDSESEAGVQPRDASADSDLPLMAVPYLVVAPPPPDAPADQPRDSESDAGVQPRDASADVWIPPIIYGVFIQPTAEPNKR